MSEITDEQIAEIIEFVDDTCAADSDEVRGIKVGPLRALITRLREAEADAARFYFAYGGDDRMVEVERDALYIANPDIDWYRAAIDAYRNGNGGE